MYTELDMGPILWGRTTDIVSFTPNLVNFKHFVLIQKSNKKSGFRLKVSWICLFGEGTNS